MSSDTENNSARARVEGISMLSVNSLIAANEQQVAANLTETLSDLIALRVFHIAAEVGGGHTMRFIADG